MKKYFFLFYIVILVCSCRVQAVEFVVEDVVDRTGVESTISDDGRFFSGKGSANIILSNWNDPYTKLGEIDWKENMAKYSKEYFLYSNHSEPYLLIKKSMPFGNNYSTNIEMYNISGGKIGRLVLDKELIDKFLSVSPNKKVFGIFDGAKVRIFNSALNEINGFLLDKKVLNPEFFQIANDGSEFILGGEDNLLLGSINESKSEYVSNWVPPTNFQYTYRTNACEDCSNQFIVLVGNGDLFFINKAKSEKYHINLDSDMLGVYFDSKLLYVVTSDSLSVYSCSSNEFIGKFEVKPYYNKKYGEHSNENPFIIDHTFNSSTKTFILKDSFSIKTVFIVKISA